MEPAAKGKGMELFKRPDSHKGCPYITRIGWFGD